MTHPFRTLAESRNPSVLIIDDEPHMCDFLREALRDHGFFADTAESGSLAIEKAQIARYDLVLCDLKMPGMGGLETLERIKTINPDVEVIVITAHGTLENAIESLRMGASDFLQKPILLNDLLFSVGKALERRDLRERLGLFELSRSIFSTLQQDELYGRVVQSAVQVLRGDDASLMLLDENRKLQVAISTSLRRELQEKIHLEMGERIAGRVALQAEPVVINENVSGDERFQGVQPMRPIHASIVCPLTMRDQLLGVLNVSRVNILERYTEHDRRNAMILASLVALALGNARLHEELQVRLRQIQDVREELIQNEKMLALGNLLSGVAHELNNPLCGVLGYAQLLQQGNADPKMRKGVEVILREAERATKIVANLLTFARREKPEKKPLGVNGVIMKTVERKTYDLKACRIEVKADLDPKLPLVMGDFHQLMVVFGNLVTNAQQAMFDARGQGTLSIKTEVRGERVSVTLSDDGPGIPQENVRRVFDPFFTTREVGKGVGLGLSVCFAIVRDHLGVIRVAEPQAGRGATFVIELPVAPPEAIEAAGRAATAAAPEALEPRILVADAEVHVQDLLVELLRGMGYRVDTAGSREGALAKIRASEYDALIADFGMPHLDGRALLSTLKTEKPALSRRVIFLASDAASPPLMEFALAERSILIGKPFDLDTMRAALKRVLAMSPEGVETVH